MRYLESKKGLRHVRSGLVFFMVSLLLVSITVAAADLKTRAAFKLTELDKVVVKITGNATVNKSDKIQIIVPPIAELGSQVGVRVRANGLKNVESITILAEKNTNPMLASFKIAEGTVPFIKSRVKLRESTKVVALVKAGGQYYTTSKVVKITIGGCGGGSSK